VSITKKEEVTSEYKEGIENVVNIVNRWNKEHTWKKRMESDEEIHKEMCEAPFIVPRIVIRVISPAVKSEEKKVKSLLLRRTLPIKLQGRETSVTSSRDSANSNRSSNNNKT